MKIYYSSFLFLSFCLLGFMTKAQQAMVASGGDITSVSGQVSYSIGQPVYTLITHQGTSINQGVQQPDVNVRLSVKAFLSGAFDSGTGLMRDSLRVKNLLPTSEPYSPSPYNRPVIYENAGETIHPSMLANGSSNAIVDWVMIELRPAANPALVVANKRGLIQRDGDVVSHLDGVSPVLFEKLSSGNYYVTLKHRNHLGIMTANPVVLGPQSTTIDFTTLNSVYTIIGPINAPRRLEGSVYTLWPADANINKAVKYNGIASDKDAVLSALGGISFINSSLDNIYRAEDLNLDGKIRFNSTNNDRLVILNAIGVSTPNNTFNQHTPN